MKPRPYNPDSVTRLTAVHKAVILYFVFIFLAMIWPIYPLFNSIFPLVLGMPLSLFYLVFLLALSFLVLLSLYLWEHRQSGTR